MRHINPRFTYLLTYLLALAIPRSARLRAVKIHHGSWMQNILIRPNMCGKFHYDRLRNDRALGDRNSDNNNPNKNKNNVTSAWGVGTRFRIQKRKKRHTQRVNKNKDRPK